MFINCLINKFGQSHKQPLCLTTGFAPGRQNTLPLKIAARLPKSSIGAWCELQQLPSSTTHFSAMKSQVSLASLYLFLFKYNGVFSISAMSGLFCVLLCLFVVEIHADGGVDFENKYCDPYRPGLTPDQAKAAMDVCFAIFMNERDYRPDNRRAVIERVCITFLLNTSTAVVRQFYLHHIKDIIAIIEAKQAKVVICNHLLCELHWTK